MNYLPSVTDLNEAVLYAKGGNKDKWYEKLLGLTEKGEQRRNERSKNGTTLLSQIEDMVSGGINNFTGKVQLPELETKVSVSPTVWVLLAALLLLGSSLFRPRKKRK